MKQILRVLICLSFLLLFSKPGICQNYDYRAPIPPTPEAASLAKFAQVPVSYSTGTPNISIPLYEIKLRDMTLPISLNYHAGGIRVDEIASSVGLGWSLSAGGSISSTVFDKPDFEARGYAMEDSAGYFPMDRDIIPYQGPLVVQGVLDPARLADYQLVKHLIGINDLVQNPNQAFDLQPDLFYYSFAGRSGKFFHTRKGKAHTVPYEPLLITNEQGNQRISITNEEGITYVFADRESSTTSYNVFGIKGGPETAGAYVPFTYVHYLSAIYTPAGDSLWFEYEPVSYTYKNQVSYTRYLGNLGQYCSTNYDTRTESLTEVTGGLRLKSIKSNLGHEVYFKYSTCNRADLPGTAALKEVEVSAQGGETKKLFRLSQGYFNSAGAALPEDCGVINSTPELVRLKLLAVEEVGKPAYKIDYNESVQLPSRMSQAQDHWGFYNGSSSLLPKDIFWGFMDGGSREPVESLMGAWTIKRLHLPTGGYTEFEFEPHQAYGVRVEVEPIAHHIAYYNSDYLPSSEPATKEITFEIGSSISNFGVQLRFEVSDASLALSDYVRAEIRGVSDPSYSRQLTKKSSMEGERLQLFAGTYKLLIETMGSFDDAFVRLDWNEIQQQSVTDNQMAGGLRVKKIKDYSGESKPMVREFLYKSLTDTTRSSGKLLYLPQYVSQSQVWTGLMPEKTVPMYEEFCNYTIQSSRSSTPLSTLSGSSVAYTVVGVLTGEGRSTQNLSTYKYSFEQDHTPHAGPPFTPPTSMEWARGLLLEETDYLYKPETHSFQPVRRKKNSYIRNYTPPNGASESGNYYLPNGLNEAHALGLQIFVKQPEYMHHRGGCEMCRESAIFQIESFKHVSVWQFLSSTEERLYNAGDTTNFIATTSHFYYDNPLHAQLTRTRRNESNGSNLISRVTYPGDYFIAGAQAPTGEAALGLKALWDKHIINKPIESQEWRSYGVDSLLVSSTLSLYKPFVSSAVLSKVFSYEAAQPTGGQGFSPARLDGQGAFTFDSSYKEEFRFEKYSGFFNLLEFSKRGFLTSLVWDESQGLVTAEIKGAASAQASYTSFESAFENGRWSLSGTRAESADAKTGRYYFTGTATANGSGSLTGGMYQVSLWAKGGGTVTINGQTLQVPTDWKQFSVKLNNPGQVSVSCSGSTRMDELRLHPVEAQMTTYTYEPLVGMSSSTDPNGRSTYYEYDDLGRLMAVKDEEGNVLQTYDYQYKNQ